MDGISWGACARAYCALEVKLGVNRGQVPNFSAPQKMTISQPRKGLFEVCKDANPSPISGQVDRMSLGACACAYCALEVKLGVNKGQVPNFSAPLKLTISQPRRGLFEVCKDPNPCPVSG